MQKNKKVFLAIAIFGVVVVASASSAKAYYSWKDYFSFGEIKSITKKTNGSILKAIADDIKHKPRDRSKELAIACKVKGLYKADNDQKGASPDIQDADFIEIIRAYKLKDKAYTSLE